MLHHLKAVEQLGGRCWGGCEVGGQGPGDVSVDWKRLQQQSAESKHGNPLQPRCLPGRYLLHLAVYILLIL